LNNRWQLKYQFLNMKKSLSFFACTCLATALFAQTTIQRTVFFETNQSVVQPQFKNELQSFSDSVKRLNAYSIVLKGHTDAIGSNVSNQKLSLKRVQNVQLVLEKQGIPSSLIKTAAFGKEMPIADNATETGKQNNRRVDIIVTFNDSKVASAQKYNNMLDLYKDLSQKAQLFKINTARDTLIKGAKGTILFIPKGAFQNVPADAIVDFRLKEAYQFSDIIAENLNTHSGDKLLQTGGMFYADARYSGQMLTLKRDLKVSFPSEESKLTGMQLFKGDRDMTQNGKIDWQPINYTLDKQELPSVSTSMTMYTLGETNDFNPYFLSNKDVGLKFKDLIDTVGAFPLLSAAEVQQASTGKITVKRATKLSDIGVAMSYYYYLKPSKSKKTLLEAHKEVFFDMYAFYKVNTFNELWQKDGKEWDNELENRVGMLKGAILVDEYNARKDSLLGVRGFQLSEKFLSAFPLPKLGWTNCDRFWQANPTNLVEVGTTPMLARSPKSQLVLVLPNQQMILNSGFEPSLNSPFGKVPKGIKGFVVGMKIENGQSYLSLHSITTDDMKVTLDYKPMSSSEIKEKLKLLDNG
jgi:OmpA family